MFNVHDDNVDDKINISIYRCGWTIGAETYISHIRSFDGGITRMFDATGHEIRHVTSGRQHIINEIIACTNCTCDPDKYRQKLSSAEISVSILADSIVDGGITMHVSSPGRDYTFKVGTDWEPILGNVCKLLLGL
jgi:hypothetical protein